MVLIDMDKPGSEQELAKALGGWSILANDSSRSSTKGKDNTMDTLDVNAVAVEAEVASTPTPTETPEVAAAAPAKKARVKAQGSCTVTNTVTSSSCGKPVTAKGYCPGCYQLARKYGWPMPAVPGFTVAKRSVGRPKKDPAAPVVAAPAPEATPAPAAQP